MHDFVFWNPTKVVFGKDTVKKVGEEAASFGKKALFVYGGGSIRRNGVYDAVVGSVKAAGIETIEFGGVKPNPVLSHLRAGIELAKAEKVDFILAVGGGSVIDESKAIAAGAVTDEDVWKFFTQESKIKAALPVVTVLTIPAAGSEMNGGLVITNEQTQDKFGFSCPHLYPKVSILDPTVTYTIPASYSAYSAADAMSHLMEGYFTHTDPWAPIQERYAEGLVKTIMEATEKILADGCDYQARATMMWGATLAWNGLGNAGLGATSFPNHMIEHAISAVYDIPHGAGLSIVIPAWMSYFCRKFCARFAQFARNVFGVQADDNLTAAKKGIEALKDWFDEIGTPTTLTRAGIAQANIQKIADAAMRLAAVWQIKGYSSKIVADILRLAK